MQRPDFAVTDLSRLGDRDFRFLVENFPQPGRSYEEFARVMNQLPTTFESLLNSDYLYQKVCQQSLVLRDVSPFLLFNVLLRRSLSGHRSSRDRKIVNYIANLLSIFVNADRVCRVRPHDKQTYQYLVDMIQEAQLSESRQQFLLYSHIGNYSLFISGLFPEWIEYRHRYKRRPVDTKYYINFGRTYYGLAAKHPMARHFNLDDVFLRLAMMFESYKESLNHLSRNYLFAPKATLTQA
ncbi:MAG: hypothetical protein L0Y67_05090 [Gammaproteobacteria bacterium]|nr:hypothetical protein [Gammaproteobacteria bacterium]MCI0590965.1 hypothetical protein [Gammaproteobacteria bacterium]